MGSPLNVSYVQFFRFMLQFLCLQMCVCSGSAVPQGGGGVPSLGDRPPGGGGEPSSLAWGTTRGGGGMSQARYSYPAQVSVIVFLKHRLSCIMILVV